MVLTDYVGFETIAKPKENRIVSAASRGVGEINL